jgi:hypothetical protein
MALDIFLFLLGLAIAGFTLRDVFETVIVPGGNQASLHIARRLVFVLLPLWKSVRGSRRGLSGTFAPFVLVGSFVIWMSLLALGFGLIAFAFRSDFHPPIHNFGDAVYVVGSALVTVGLSENLPYGAGRWIVLAAGFCGLAVMTMAVTYLLEVQASIARRDTGIIKLNTSAGEPPSALALLERFAAIRNQGEVLEVLKEGRNWCTTVRQSHSAHPSLIYFQTDGTGSGWPAALGSLLDLSLIMEHLVDDDATFGPAVLLRDDGVRMATELAALLQLTPNKVAPTSDELREVAKRLRKAGYAVRPRVDLDAIANQRAQAQSAVEAIAEHLGKPSAILVRKA